jgi:hypothetical protein
MYEINEIYKYEVHEKQEWVVQFSAIWAAYTLLVCVVFAVTIYVNTNAALLLF